jgi:hypothetical protein
MSLLDDIMAIHEKLEGDKNAQIAKGLEAMLENARGDFDMGQGAMLIMPKAPYEEWTGIKHGSRCETRYGTVTIYFTEHAKDPLLVSKAMTKLDLRPYR